MHTRTEPKRKCMGCNEMFSKKELVRVVKTKIADDPETYEITLDLTGKKAGRGAYVCKKAECLRKARKAKRLERALDCSIPDDVYEKLEQEMSADA